jgi:hypothetical protein
MNIYFEDVEQSDEHANLLYEMLKSRIYSISHGHLPTLQEHKQFFSSHPYRHWYLIRLGSTYIGNIYVQNDNSIGINIEEQYYHGCLREIFKQLTDKVIPLPPIKSVRGASFSINVSPANDNLMRALEELGLEIAQVTYVL